MEGIYCLDINIVEWLRRRLNFSSRKLGREVTIEKWVRWGISIGWKQINNYANSDSSYTYTLVSVNCIATISICKQLKTCIVLLMRLLTKAAIMHPLWLWFAKSWKNTTSLDLCVEIRELCNLAMFFLYSVCFFTVSGL